MSRAIRDRREPVRYCRPSLGGTEAGALKDAFESGWLGSGVYTRLFESRLAQAVGLPHAAATNSGTAALHLAVRVLDVEGGEVVTTALTNIATGHAVLYNRARPVFCDVEEDTGNIDCGKLAALLTRKTKAILVVHLDGHACDMDPILELARARGLPVVEDACAALPLDGSYKGRALGTLGDLGCFSFSRLKNLTTVDGGAVVHRRPELVERLARLRRLGQGVEGDWVAMRPEGLSELGYHYRMNDMAAVVGLAQLKRWGELSARLESLSRRYRDGLTGLPGIALPRERPYARRSLSYFALRVSGGRRAALCRFLKARGVETGEGIYPLHFYELYKPYHRALPVAERLAGELLYLPFHPALSEAEAGRVVDAVRAFRG